MHPVRRPAVAGLFYPANPLELRETVTAFLRTAIGIEPAPKAIIAPHAGYVYSGAIAASAYALLAPVREQIHRVVLLGPSHRVGFYGLAVPSVDLFATPLGDIPLDRAAIDQISTLPGVCVMDQAHALEHSLEVHLPFLQIALADFKIVPIVVGDADASTVARVIDALWGGDETLIVVSSDLSHYHDYQTARALDQATSEAIETLHPEQLDYESACGRNPVAGLLTVAKQRGLHAKTIDLRNSGDTSGPRNQVVGYGAYVFH